MIVTPSRSERPASPAAAPAPPGPRLYLSGLEDRHRDGHVLRQRLAGVAGREAGGERERVLPRRGV